MGPSRFHQELLATLVAVQRATARPGAPRFLLGYGTALGAVRSGSLLAWDFDVDILVPWPDYSTFVDDLRRNLDDRFTLHGPGVSPNYEELFVRVSPTHVEQHLMHVDVFPLIGAPASKPAQRALARATRAICIVHRLKQVQTSRRYWWSPTKKRVAQAAKMLLFPLPRRLPWVLWTSLADRFDFDRRPYVFNGCGNYGTREFFPRSALTSSAWATLDGHAMPVPADPGGYLAQLYGDFMTEPPVEEQLDHIDWHRRNIAPHIADRESGG